MMLSMPTSTLSEVSCAGWGKGCGPAIRIPSPASPGAQPIEYDLQHRQALVGHEAGADDLSHARAGFAGSRPVVEAKQAVDFRLVQDPRRLGAVYRGRALALAFAFDLRAPGSGKILVGLLGCIAH